MSEEIEKIASREFFHRHQNVDRAAFIAEAKALLEKYAVSDIEDIADTLANIARAGTGGAFLREALEQRLSDVFDGPLCLDSTSLREDIARNMAMRKALDIIKDSEIKEAIRGHRPCF